MVKLDPVGEDGEGSGSIVDGWGGQLLWKVYVTVVQYWANVEYDLAETQNSCGDNEEEKLVYVCKR